MDLEACKMYLNWFNKKSLGQKVKKSVCDDKIINV